MPASAQLLLERGTAELERVGISEARFESELLLRHALGCTREWLFARLNEPVAPEVAGHFFQLLERRRSRVPVQHLLGAQEFFGLSFRVTPAVLIPRPETEGVVEEALVELRGRERPRVADVGCGSGCIAIALAKSRPDAEVIAIDTSAAALAVARENARVHAVSERLDFLVGNLLEPLLDDPGTLDVVASNPPYVSDSDLEGLEPEVGEHEPRLALAGGQDGLAIIGRLLPQAQRVLRPGAALVLEIGQGQDARVSELVVEAGLDLVRVVPDLAGIPRVVVARAR